MRCLLAFIALSALAGVAGADCPCTGAPVCSCGPACGCEFIGLDDTLAPELVVCCPEGAVLSIDGRATGLTGGKRVFACPKGAKGVYTVRCTIAGWSETRKVAVRPGCRTTAYFTGPAQRAPVFIVPPMAFRGGGGGSC
jgi:hypothetical protein